MTTPHIGQIPPHFHPGISHRTHAALPSPWNKTRLLNLVDEAARFFGLTSTDLRVLHRIALKTRAEDYQSTNSSPICFERQLDMASSIGLSPSQWRRVEAKLHHLRFISRDTAMNGYRGSRATHDGVRAFAGISLEPMIERLTDLIDAKAWAEHIAEQFSLYRLEVSARRRTLNLLCQELGEHNFCEEIDSLKATWRRPRSYSDLTKLVEHFFELESLVDKGRQILRETKDMRAAPRINARHHIQSTTKPSYESCNAGQDSPAQDMPACQQADAISTFPSAKADGKCLENKAGVEGSSVKANLIENLTVAQIRDLADPDMQLYIDHLRSDPGPRSESDLDAAAIARCRDLGINPSAYEMAVDQMGWRNAVLCLIVIGQNINHPNPKYAIRSPGGALRAMTKRHVEGNLHLNASVIALWKRQTHPTPTRTQ